MRALITAEEAVPRPLIGAVCGRTSGRGFHMLMDW